MGQNNNTTTIGEQANNGPTIVSYNLTKEELERKMRPLLARNIKFYERKVKQYVKDNLYYEVVLDHKDEISDIRSYVKSAVDYDVRDGMVKVAYNKSKKPIHTFSSSYDMHDISYIRRLTFRINNRIFINFDFACNVDGEQYNKVFMNANIDQNVDYEYIQTEMKQYLEIMMSG